MSNNNWTEAGNTGDAWKPEQEGDTIQGKYIAHKTDVGMNNSNVYVVQIKGESEPKSIWGSAVLDNKFQEIPLNSEVRIEFLGKIKGKGPVPYKDFKVLYKAPATIEASVQEVFPDAEMV